MKKIFLILTIILLPSLIFAQGKLNNAGDIVKEAQRRLFRDPATISSSDIFSSSQCFVWLNSAMLDLASELPADIMPQLMTINTCDVVDQQADYSIPRDTITGVFLRYVDCETNLVIISTPVVNYYWTTKIPVEQVRETELTRVYNPTTTHPFLYIWNDSIWFIRDSTNSLPSVAPTATVNAGIKLYYIREPKAVGVDTDEPQFDKRFYDLLVTGILRRAYEKIKDWESAAAQLKIWDLVVSREYTKIKPPEK